MIIGHGARQRESEKNKVPKQSLVKKVSKKMIFFKKILHRGFTNQARGIILYISTKGNGHNN